MHPLFTIVSAFLILSHAGLHVAVQTRSVLTPIQRDDQPLPVNGLTLKDIVRAANENPLSAEEKNRTINIALRLFNGFNPNIFIYRRFLKVQPTEELKKLATVAHKLNNFQFHDEMRRIFSKVNDGHTAYIPPEPFRSAAATLGFLITPYYTSAHGNIHYVVIEILEDTPVQSDLIKVGTEIVDVDGVPINKVIETIGDGSFRSNSDAQLRDGARIIFNRLLWRHPVPSGPFVEIGFLDERSHRQSVVLPWIFEMPSTGTELQESPEEDLEECHNEEVEGSPESSPDASDYSDTFSVRTYTRPNHLRRSTPFFGDQEIAMRYTGSKNNLHDRYMRQAVRRQHRDGAKSLPSTKMVPVPKCIQEFFSAMEVTTSSGTFGYLRILRFNSPTSEPTYEDLTKLILTLPTAGLIVDIRGNPGGFLKNIKIVTELLTNATTNAMPGVVRASSVLWKMVNPKNENSAHLLSDCKSAIETAVELRYSLTGPFGDRLWFGAGLQQRLREQKYFGPVVVVTDAISFSASDVFAAMQRDTGAALVVGVDGRTGGGGASTIPYKSLHELFTDAFPHPLPVGIDIRSAFIQVYRTGFHSGAIIENIGVEPDERYFITRRDVLNGDADLFEHLGKRLFDRRRL